MPSIKSITKAAVLTITALSLSLVAPLGALAAEPSDCTAPDHSDQRGVHWPTGSDAGTFTYQCEGQYAGKWTNQYYVYDPATQSRTALYSRDYSYDCASSTWYMTDMDYSPAKGTWSADRVATSNPGLSTNCPVAPAVPAAENTAPSSSANRTAASATTTTGPDSSNTTNNSANSGLNVNNSTVATMNNTVASAASSGNALVLGNTIGGSATSGNAQSMADIVNMLQSSSNVLGSDGNLIVFTKNIDGDVNGDLLLDPAQLGSIQNTANNTDLNNQLTINNSTDAAINNDVTLTANSGSATVSKNTEGGDATTGNAQAVANIVNVINSALTAGQSFIGTININGNLNGDILLPDNFVDQLIAANVPTVTISAPDSTNSSNTSTANNAHVTNTNNLGITNNVNANAGSGTATVTNNTGGGTAKSGNATTSITAFNLTGSTVVGANSILVFVNAPGGKWVGVIVNAPAGATAAELGGGITQNTTATNDATINNDTNAKITNNVTTDAHSGDATVSKNTSAGNATSGDAASHVNLSNIENSKLSFTGWLGILFINVFGTWNGSFGVNTSAGDPVVASTSSATGGSNLIGGIKQVFSFVPSNDGTATFAPVRGSGGGSSGSVASDTGLSGNQAVLAAKTAKGAIAPTPQLQSERRSLVKTFAIIAFCVLAYIVADAIYTSRKTRSQPV